MFRLACVLLLLLLTYQLVKGASCIMTRGEDSSSSKRTMFNIVWGCVSTTIICAWAAVHPNIPPREGPVKKTLRRLELMFWTIVAPEILPCWALKQLLAAMTVRDMYNKAKGYEKERCGIWETMKGWFSWHEITEEATPAWTVAHGHFLIMGGFHLVEPHEDRSTEASTDTQRPSDALDVAALSVPLLEATNMDMEKGKGRSEKKLKLEKGRVTLLTLKMLEELVKDPEFEIQVTEEEITDKSKGDALSKLIFILQSTWFILQCLGRRVQGLDLTQLELTTLALASLNGITFVLWWDKPLGVQAVVRVYLKRKLTDKERVRDHDGDDSVRSEVIGWIQKGFKFCVTTLRDAFLCRAGGNIFQVPVAILFILLFPIIAFTSAFGATILDVIRDSSIFFSPDDSHVPTFYVPERQFSFWYHILLLVTLAVTFGGIHCSGWNFPFPTYTEQKLWRVASLAVTTIPIAVIPFMLLIAWDNASTIGVGLASLSFFTLPFFALAYVSSRLILLGLALAHLRNLPTTAFIAINWTEFYPHIL